MNVNLWFAKDVDSNEIISVVNSNKESEYKCPICNSDVIPKAIESKRITPHFAHIDKSKCSSESFIHFWMKHQFIEVGESFTIEADKRIEYVCKNFKTEVRYELESGVYIPDIVVETECGNEIVFEMANTNKKQVKDYIDKWIELDKIIVEVDIKGMVSESREFKALYYKGKCFNFNKRDGGYYNTIGKLKEDMKQSGKYDIEAVRKLDWFWDELVRYNNEKTDIGTISIYIDEIFNNYKYTNTYDKIKEFLKSKKCSRVYTDYLLNKAYLIKQDILRDIIIPEYMRNFITVQEDVSYDKYFERCGVYVRNEYDFIGELFYENEIEEARSKLISHIESNKDNKDILFYNKIQSIKNLVEIAIDKVKDEVSQENLRIELSDSKSALNLNRIVISSSNFFTREYIELTEQVIDSKDVIVIKNFIKNRIAPYEKLFLSKNNKNDIENMLREKFISKERNEYMACLRYTPNFLKVYSINSKVDINLLVYDGEIYMDSLDNDYECNSLEKYMSRINNSKLLSHRNSPDDMIVQLEEIIRNCFDNHIRCKECRKTFELGTGEKKFFLDKGFILPKRCKPCRNKRKTEVVK